MFESPIWSVFGPFVGIYVLAVILMAAYGLWGRKPKELEDEKYSNLNIPFKEFLVGLYLWCLAPVENACVRLRVSPNALTLAGGLLALPIAYLYSDGRFVAAAWVVAVSGGLDILDGHLARRLKAVSKGGAFLDSSLDRYSEGIIFMGIAAYYRHEPYWMWAVAAMLGSMLVSYSKARGEGLGLEFKGGFLKRSERVFYLFIVSAFTPMADLLRSSRPFLPPEFLFKYSLIFMAAGTHLTAVYRIYRIHQLLVTRKGA